MRRIIFLLLIPLFLALILFYHVPNSSSDELSDITKQIQDLTNSLNESVKATQPLESQLTSMKKKIANIKGRLSFVEKDIIIKENNINAGYKNLEKQQDVLNQAIRNFYIKSYYNSPFLIFFSSSSITNMAQITAYQKAATDQDKAIITNIALAIEDLKNKKKELENEKTQLVTLKSGLDEQSAKLDKIVSGAKTYQANLSSQIAQLSSKQQDILNQRLGSLNIPLYAYNTQGGCSSDLTNGKSPGSSGGFGFFTYGVPNRVGLNQYGAWGRAKAGQSSDDILHAYYNFDGYQNMDATIKVNDSNGYNGGNIIWTGSLEDYVKRIYEVPDSWTDNNLAALKAQAIAARSYVLAETDNGNKSICANQHCQVFKTDPKGGNWDSAVGQTAGQVMIQGGKPIIAWFSSTHGGYVYSSGGDVGGASWTKNAQDATSSINSFSDLKSNAYDKDSPWFYCDWGSRSSYGGTAWLKGEEVADIANVLMLVGKDSGTKEHLYQTDKGNPAGTDTWDEARVRQELQSRGGSPLSSVSDASVNADFSSGKTSTVTISGDGGTVSFQASDFKNYFNIRAPASIQIVGPLYNIERN